jgi:hypothetical protein
VATGGSAHTRQRVVKHASPFRETRCAHARVPAKGQVLRHLRVKHACPGCEQILPKEQCLRGAARAFGLVLQPYGTV